MPSDFTLPLSSLNPVADPRRPSEFQLLPAVLPRDPPALPWDPGGVPSDAMLPFPSLDPNTL